MDRIRLARSWKAWTGIRMVKCGKRRNGKPHTVLAIECLIVTSEADRKAMVRAFPNLKFVEEGRRSPDKEK